MNKGTQWMPFLFVAVAAVWSGIVSGKFPEKTNSTGNSAFTAAIHGTTSALTFYFLTAFLVTEAFQAPLTGKNQGTMQKQKDIKRHF